MSTTLFFHSPCFDGLASAALAWDVLEGRGMEVEPRPVNYSRSPVWLAERPATGRFAVVDFLYHPEASFWADHHQTAFLGGTAQHYEDRREAGDDVWYDPSAPSCADLMARVFPEAGGHRAELVAASRKTDAALYSSPEEAVFGSQPALQLNRSLQNASDAWILELLADLRARTLEAVAARIDVQRRVQAFDRHSKAVLSVMQHHLEVQDGIAIVDWDAADGLMSRYAPYILAPDADYSVAIVRDSGKAAKITAMRNPWKDFESVEIGEIMRRYGGGGHQRVGSVVLADLDDTGRALEDIVGELRGAARLR